MKKTFSYIIFSVILSISAFGQCQTDECVAKINEGYTFLKSYKIEKIGDQLEYSYVLSKETNYMLVMCNGGTGQNTIVTMFDSNRKEIATNQDKKTGKVYPAIVYQCKATGIYYLRFSFVDQPACCVSILGFKK